jgi:3-oxoacyl-[acyl-carrier protein] reductase
MQRRDLSGINAGGNTMNLKGRVVIVTGAGRGLGRTAAVSLVRASSRVTFFSLKKDELEESAAGLEGYEDRFLLLQGDVSDIEAVNMAVEKTLERFGQIDVLVNNAAVIGPARFLEDSDPRSWDLTLDVNLNGAAHFIRAVLPAMEEQGGGKIINIVSGLGRMPYPRFCAYAVSKAGLIQLTRSLSEELSALNIQVNAVDPGVMDTGMQEEIRAMDAEMLGKAVHRSFQSLKEDHILKDPQEVADLILYLASPESGTLTGKIGTLKEYRQLGWR